MIHMHILGEEVVCSPKFQWQSQPNGRNKNGHKSFGCGGVYLEHFNYYLILEFFVHQVVR